MQDRYPDPSKLTVGVLSEKLSGRLQISSLTGVRGYERKIVSPDISRPGLCLTGYTNNFMHNRIQIFGETEITLLRELDAGARHSAIAGVFGFPVVCSIVTKGLEPPDELLAAAFEAGSTLFVSPRDTTPLIHDLNSFLGEVFAPHVSLHATMVDVFGEGLLVMGRSAIGKSEAVLGLVERGHRLVADDLVRVRRAQERLIGTGDALIGFFMEIRGIGFVDIAELYGLGATRERQTVDLAVRLIDAGIIDEAERSGLERKTMNILGVDIPLMEIPVLPGRNLTLLLEVAAMMNMQYRKSGFTSAERLNKALISRMGRGREEE